MFRRPGLAGLEEDMWRMQSKLLGGFYTGYDKDFGPVNSSTNTETTCLFLMPYTVPPPRQASPLPDPVLILAIIEAGAIVGSTTLYILRRLRRNLPH
jgi:hypothetical protein